MDSLVFYISILLRKYYEYFIVFVVWVLYLHVEDTAVYFALSRGNHIYYTSKSELQIYIKT